MFVDLNKTHFYTFGVLRSFLGSYLAQWARTNYIKKLIKNIIFMHFYASDDTNPSIYG